MIVDLKFISKKGLLGLGLLLCLFSTGFAKRSLRKSTDTQSSIKEYVVVSAGKDTVSEKLGQLYDRLKLFSNYPKNIKSIQEEIDKLEDSLKKSVAQMKDSCFVISRVKTETATCKNEIPKQESNAKAKESFNKVIEFWNTAESEIAKIKTLGEDFDKFSTQISAKIVDITKVLDEGTKEIEEIKEELEKIAQIEESVAGSSAREISQEIGKVVGKLSPKSKTPEEKSAPVEKAAAPSADKKPENQKPVAAQTQIQKPEPKAEKTENSEPKEITLRESFAAIYKLTFKFVSVAFTGAKDLFSRLFVVETEISKDKSLETQSDQKDQDKKSENSDQAPAVYKKAASDAVFKLKDALVELSLNGYSYIKELYSSMSEKSEKSEATETTKAENDDAKTDGMPKSKPQETGEKPVKMVNLKADEKKAEPAKPAKAKTEEKVEPKEAAEKPEAKPDAKEAVKPDSAKPSADKSKTEKPEEPKAPAPEAPAQKPSTPDAGKKPEPAKKLTLKIKDVAK